MYRYVSQMDWKRQQGNLRLHFCSENMLQYVENANIDDKKLFTL